MAKNIHAKLIIAGFACLITLSGCVSIKSGPAVSKGYLGVIKSADAGVSWQLSGSILNTQGRVISLADTSVNKILIDPNDSQTIYLATNYGVFYSNDAGASWVKVGYFALNQINNIADVAADYFNKCTTYVASGATIYKSTDCMRSFNIAYFDSSRTNLQVTTVTTDHYNGNVVYATNNKGEILKSEDYGKTWQLKKTINGNNSIKQVVVDKDDSRIIYFVTESEGLFKTTDGGQTWSDDKKETDINGELKNFQSAKTEKFLAEDQTQKDSFILASKYGLLKTVDGGLHWQNIELVTPERGANIYSLAIDSQNDQIFYYGTDSTLYKTTDGGKNWAPQKSPTIGVINYLVVDPKNPKTIYLGGKALTK